MLSKEEVQQLNQFMLGLGAPTERDDQGYNKPDWLKMECYGRFLPKLNDYFAFEILKALEKYKNRQLLGYKEELEETLECYKSLMPKEVYLPEDRTKYLPRDIQFVQINHHNYGFNKENIPMVELWVPTSEKWEVSNCCFEYNSNFSKNIFVKPVSFEKKDKGVRIEVRPDKLESFLLKIKNVGKYGYAETKELSNFIKHDLQHYIDEYLMYEMIIKVVMT